MLRRARPVTQADEGQSIVPAFEPRAILAHQELEVAVPAIRAVVWHGCAGRRLVGDVTARRQRLLGLSRGELDGRRPAVVHGAISVEPCDVVNVRGCAWDVAGATETSPIPDAAVLPGRRQEPDTRLVGERELFRVQLRVPDRDVRHLRKWTDWGSARWVRVRGRHGGERQSAPSHGRRQPSTNAMTAQKSPKSLRQMMFHVAHFVQLAAAWMAGCPSCAS